LNRHKTVVIPTSAQGRTAVPASFWGLVGRHDGGRPSNKARDLAIASTRGSGQLEEVRAPFGPLPERIVRLFDLTKDCRDADQRAESHGGVLLFSNHPF
jgi:hypothetical protein